MSAFLIVFGVSLIAGAILSGCRKQTPIQSLDKSPLSELQIGEKTYNVELAKTQEEQQHGLSGRDQIGSDGLLFIFPQARKVGFWMVDMKFDLDFVWIEGGVVTEITPNVPKPKEGQSQDELPRYYPQSPASMMLEVPAGFAQREGIKVGDVVKLTE